MSSKLYTSRDVELCFPWISAATTNYRVKHGAIPLTNPSSGTGIPNTFTITELVHCAVIDELASLGVFGNLHTSSVNYHESFRNENGELLGKSWGSPGPYPAEMDFYERWDYRVVVEVQIHHKDLPGTNVHDVGWHGPTEKIPFVHIEPIPKGWGRYYYVLYAPEYDLDEKPFIQGQLDRWLDPAKIKIHKTLISKGFIHVRRLFDMAVDVLGLTR